MPDNPDISLASMGIYVFNTGTCIKQLEENNRGVEYRPRLRQGHHPAVVRNGLAVAHPFGMSCVTTETDAERDPYWRDVGTVDAYWSANIDLTSTIPALDMYDTNWPIWTYQEQLAARRVRARPERAAGRDHEPPRVRRLRGVGLESIALGVFSRVRINSFCKSMRPCCCRA